MNNENKLFWAFSLLSSISASISRVTWILLNLDEGIRNTGIFVNNIGISISYAIISAFSIYNLIDINRDHKVEKVAIGLGTISGGLIFGFGVDTILKGDPYLGIIMTIFSLIFVSSDFIHPNDPYFPR